MKVVISQPMYFPWVGLFEQICLSDRFVFYDDVQFEKGGFINRVQIKTNTSEGFKWLTVPLKHSKLNSKINEIEIDSSKSWRRNQLSQLKQFYQKAPHLNEMLELVEAVFAKDYENISDLAIESIQTILSYFEINNKEIYKSSNLNISGQKSERVLDIVKFLNGNIYITGHGAKNYLNHSMFVSEGIEVEYMDYQKKEYSQLHGSFNPYVSILDLIANHGINSKENLISNTINWKQISLKNR